MQRREVSEQLSCETRARCRDFAEFEWLSRMDGRSTAAHDTEEIPTIEPVPAVCQDYPHATIFRPREFATRHGSNRVDVRLSIAAAILPPRTLMALEDELARRSKDAAAERAVARRLRRRQLTAITSRICDDFPCKMLDRRLGGTRLGELPTRNFTSFRHQPEVIQRCLLMTTDPGDLVFDPTCGSGTTAYVAEQWGRRWITCDTSRVAITLAKQRLMTAVVRLLRAGPPEQKASAAGSSTRPSRTSRSRASPTTSRRVRRRSTTSRSGSTSQGARDRPVHGRGRARADGASRWRN